MKLSVIICTYNREKYIRPLLESIAANDLDKQQYEIVLVDNNCTDHTRQVCEQFAMEHTDVTFRYVVEQEQGLSVAKNKGIREAKGDLIVYIDDDALVDTHYLKDYADWFEQHPETMAAGGPVQPRYEEGEEPAWMTPYTRSLLTAWMDYGDKVREYPKGRYPGGGNAAYRKEVFEKVGVFNTALGRKGGNLMGSEEKDIFAKMHQLGMQVLYLPNPVLHHLIPAYKLGEDYFNRLTCQIGISERQRTLAISKWEYSKRLMWEAIKWAGTLVLWLQYFISLQMQKGNKLVSFRYNVTRGLLGLG